MKTTVRIGLRCLALLSLLLLIHTPVQAAVLTWTGNSHGVWTNASNWLPAFRPTNGDALLFPDGVSRLLTTNRTGGATNFQSLTLSGGDYLLVSQPLALTNGLTNSVAFESTNRIIARITARSNQAWHVSAPSVLVLSSNVNFTNVLLNAAVEGVLQFDNTVSATTGGTLNKTNAGRLELNGSSSIAQVHAREGELQVNGTLSGALTIYSGATLSGTGSVPAFASAGAVQPGRHAPGVLTVTSGSATFNAGSSLRVQMKGTGLNCGQLRVASPPNLAGASLELVLNYHPLLGDAFVIITNTGSSSFTTVFAGLPEGATQTVNHTQFRISYSGGTGNDVTLTVVGFTASPEISIWDGEGSGYGWLTAANWSNNISPAGGQSLLFPANAAQFNTSNNFPNGTIFNALTVEAAYDFSGNALTLLGGIDSRAPAGSTVQFRPRVVFSGSQTVRVEHASSTLNLGVAGLSWTIDGPLSVEGDGLATVVANLNGSGGLDIRGRASFAGNNTYSGVTRILPGASASTSAQGLGAATAADDTFVEAGGALQIFNAASIAEPLRLAGALDGFSGFSWTGPVTLLGSTPTFTLQFGINANFNGAISGTNVLLTQFGLGALTLNGNNSVAGTLINPGDGSTIVNGLSPALHINTQGTLGGTGTVANVSAGDLSTLRPGQNGSGTLTCSNLTLANSQNDFVVDFSGGTTHGRLRAKGAVQLGGTLWLNFAETPPFGLELILLANDGPAAISGTFIGLPEGAHLSTNGITFRVSYSGGDGNDLSIVRELAITGVTRVWDGGGGNTLWSNPLNWSGDIAPVEGDRLEFPDNSPSRTNSNNLPPHTAFHSIHFTGASGGRYVLDGNPLQLLGGILATNGGAHQVLNTITLLGAQTFESRTGTLTFSGSITNQGLELTLRNHGGTLQMAGAMRGAGGVRKSGLGDAIFSVANSYEGGTHIEAGALTLSGSGTLGSTNGATFVASDATLVLQPAANSIMAEPLQLAGSLINSLRTNTWTGPMELTGDASLDVALNTQLMLSNHISGAGGFIKSGSGTLVVTGENSFAGETTFMDGTIFVSGSQTNSAVLMTGAATTLLGSGTLGPLTALDGIISPATALNDSTAVLTVGDLFAASACEFHLRLNGLTPGTQHDRLRVRGSVNLSGARLLITNGFAPAPGATFTILENDGTDANSGTFFGLSEGTTLTTNGITLRISYVGGDGNDVTLSRPFVATGVTRVWDGGGAGNLFSDPVNWAGNGAPQQGDSLAFPRGVSKVNVIFDAGPNAVFNSITIGTNYSLSTAGSDSLRLFAGISVTNTAGAALVHVPIRLESNQSWTVSHAAASLGATRLDLGISTLTHLGNGTLTLASNVVGHGNLALNGAGTLRLHASNSFSGTVIVNAGRLVIRSAHALGDLLGGTIIGTAGTLDLSEAQNLQNPESLTLAGRISGNSANNVTWSGPITLAGAQARIDVEQPFQVYFSGPLSGGGFTTLGNGIVVRNGATPYAGPVTVGGNSQFYVNSQQPSLAVTLTNSGALGGTGRVGVVTAAAGQSGFLVPGFGWNETGQLITGNAQLNSGTLRLTLSTPSVHDRWRVEGTVTLNGATLSAEPISPPAIGAAFLVLENDGAEPINGHFLGYPPGSYLYGSGYIFQISYTGGTGNDVTLTRVAAAPPSTVQAPRFSDGAPVLQGLGMANAPYVLEAAAHLHAPIPWQPLVTNYSDSAGLYQFIDSAGTNFPLRFYRVVSP